MPSNINWLTMRTAGVLMKLQATPLTSGNYWQNPLKSATSSTAAHTRAYYTNWPSGTVAKIKNGGTPVVNGLTLETTSEYLYSFDYEADMTWNLDPTLPAGYMNNFASAVWDGGDDLTYQAADFVGNIPVTIDGEPKYNNILFSIVYPDIFTATSSITDDPITYAHNSLHTFPSESAIQSASAQFSGDVITSQMLFTDYSPSTLYPSGNYVFTPRMSSDDPHGLASFIHAGTDPFANALITTTTTPAGFYSYLHDEADQALGQNNKIGATCQFYYEPSSACEDCWYAGKTVTIELTYKKAAVTYEYSYVPNSGDYGSPSPVAGYKTPSLGSWSSHSTVTKTLTLPSGTTRQSVGASFAIPTLAGHVVALDDIRLVSVS